ncbi:hypothetical protein NDU88_001902 [Pleurodeles waltl]|uniref:Uncharacterized protein n=1 Tax=Pleurodeles waltl TaxID=8319 RepID=A0AAV7WJQ3_PLEWA|nr:hypothetical protein NDU88_001902 [Pleurodeles waltl]
MSSSGTLWEAFKVVIRGICLSKQHGALKALRREMADIEGRLVELERRLAEGWSGEVLAEIRREVSLYEEASLREICFTGRHARARRYGEGERAGRTLADMLRRPWASNYVTEVVGAEGEKVTGTNGVMQVLTEYFAQLYAAPEGLNEAAAQTYFADIALVWFDEAHRLYLDVLFSVEEVAAAIRGLPDDRSPGIDDLTPPFYKEYVDILAPYLL